MTKEKHSKLTGIMPAQVARVAALVDHQRGAVVSREILKTPTGRVTIFAFDKGEGLSEHTSPFHALVQVVQGEVEIMISGKEHRVKGGEMILMPARQPHALKAVKRFKMVLTMLRP